jgi:hypothetical protein
MAARFPSSLAACFYAAVFLLFCLGRAVIPEAKRPVVVVRPSEIDLGRVAVGHSVTTGFTLGNSGSAPLIIRDVRSSCECSTAILAGRDLRPGESEPVTVVFKPRVPGFRRHQILIRTNDPRRPALVVTLVATGTP